MTEERREIIGPILGEVTQETIEVANAIAEALLADEPGEKIKHQSPDGQKVEGIAFRSSRGTAVIVTDEYIAIDNRRGKIAKFLPRKLK